LFRKSQGGNCAKKGGRKKTGREKGKGESTGEKRGKSRGSEALNKKRAVGGGVSSWGLRLLSN